MSDYLSLASDYWFPGLVVLLALVAVGLVVWGWRRDRTVYVPAQVKPGERLVPRFSDTPQEADTPGETIEQIHKKYERLKDENPRQTADLMYQEMLRLHGK